MYSDILLLSSFLAIFECTASAIAEETLNKRAVCTATSAGKSSVDDTPAIESVIAAGGKGGTIVLPAGVQYTIQSPVRLTGCVDCEVQIDGTLKASDDLDYWYYQNAIITMSGVRKAKVWSPKGTGLIDGNGQAAYDYFATNSSLKRPALYTVRDQSTDITISNLRLKNSPGTFFYVGKGSARVDFDSLQLSSASKSDNPPKNTDGFDVWDATYVTISDTVVTNQDDCVAFKAGCNYVTVNNTTCTGSHGLSVGSLGKELGSLHVVRNVIVNGAKMIDSTKAVGIKTYPGGPKHGSSIVQNVTWKDVDVINCDYAVQLGGCYNEKDSYCEQYPSNSTFQNIRLINFSGTTSKRYTTGTAQVYCPENGFCDVAFDNYKVAAGKGTSRVVCDKGIERTITGVTCVAE